MPNARFISANGGDEGGSSDPPGGRRVGQATLHCASKMAIDGKLFLETEASL